jgi:MiaB-like tRNA modifying enzyme
MTKIAFKTFGCTLNQADSELMMGLLKEAGYDVVGSGDAGDGPDSADLVVVNGCSVKSLAEKKFFKAVQDVISSGKKVVVAGCVAQAEQDYVSTKLRNYSIVGTKQLNKMVHVVEETLAGNIVQMLGGDKNERFNVPRVRRNKVVGIVPIAEGCLGECAYCKARLARGKLISYDPDAIVKQVVADVGSGCKEIWLTSQDCGAYGKDIGTSIVQLLRAVLEVEGDFFVRLGMMNPNFVVEYVDDFIDIYKENKGKLFWFLHVPVQAGSDRVLKLMKRNYNVSDFVSVCEQFRKELPEITIATDIICGFPGESESEFSESMVLMRKIQPDVINISRFWPRPGTEAAQMKGQLIGRETNARSREMRKVLEEVSLSRNKTWEGWQGSVLIDEKGSVGSGESWVGRNYAYKPVGLKGRFRLGDYVEISVLKACKYHLEGK